MALINCIECNTKISDRSTSCPHCGAPTSLSLKSVEAKTPVITDQPFELTPEIAKSNKAFLHKMIFWGLAGLVVPIGMIWFTPNTGVKKAVEPYDEVYGAKAQCMHQIKQRLHNPDSAEFAHTSEASASKDETGAWRVVFPVRAENGFGALRLVNFECMLVYSDGAWATLGVMQQK